ncbi:YheC/YheD family protein [Alicyclobacillus herbarius]|uniref:YheC/YheD family endospore coat-associated protein n=1 Tax=Alicyclobacillus herbarius TaxID=122960 RepID=UPI0004291A96|nr:YheC/YheD family protein [Alicyclobacillus herbarius]
MDTDRRMKLEWFPDPYSSLRLHPRVFRTLTPSETSMSCDLVCAGRTFRVPLGVDATVPADTIRMSSKLARELGIFDLRAELTAFFINGKLRIGPLVGILCNPRWDERRQSLKVTQQLLGLEKLAAAAREAGALCYLFGASDVDLEERRVRGYVHDGNSWSPHQLPLPDVIYDQVVSRRVERRAGGAKVRKELSKVYGDRIFNDGFFDKWQVHEWLMANSRTRGWLPATTRYTTTAAAAGFISRYPLTYLKPVHGSLGLGVVRVERTAEGYQWTVRRKHAPAQAAFAPSAEEVVERLKSRLCSRPYLLQQGILLATVHNRPFDIRILMQRDGSGQWRRTKMFARVAKSGEITSNLSSGGEAQPVPEVIRAIAGKELAPTPILRKIRRAAREVVDVVEKGAGKSFAELGIDIGVDQEGRIWVIEVNSKPWKTPESAKGRQDLTELAFIRPIQYAIHLAEQI